MKSVLGGLSLFGFALACPEGGARCIHCTFILLPICSVFDFLCVSFFHCDFRVDFSSLSDDFLTPKNFSFSVVCYSKLPLNFWWHQFRNKGKASKKTKCRKAHWVQPHGFTKLELNHGKAKKTTLTPRKMEARRSILPCKNAPKGLLMKWG